MITVLQPGRKFIGTCKTCGCIVEATQNSTHAKYVSRRYPEDSIGFLGDPDKKIVRFADCPHCDDSIEVTPP